MEKIITHISNTDLKKSLFKNAQFILFAGSGAMGCPGNVVVITYGGSIFQGNYCYDDIKYEKLLRAIPILNDLENGAFNNENDASNGWNLQYLGAGNVLLIRDDAYEEFKKLTEKVEYAEDFDQIWFDTAWSIIEKQNKGKHPVVTKTDEELELTKRFGRPMDDDGRRHKEKMEKDPVNVNRITITPKLIHENGIPEGTIRTNLGFFSDHRSYMAELWYSEDTTSVTYYFPVDDPITGRIPKDKKIIKKYLINEEKLRKHETHNLDVSVLKKENGIEIYSVTVAIACEDERYCEANL